MYIKDPKLAEDIKGLSKKHKSMLMSEYEDQKLTNSNGWVLGIFWLHYVHTKQYWLFILYLLSWVIWIWLIRRVIQLIMLNGNLEKYNDNLLRTLFYKYNY